MSKASGPAASEGEAAARGVLASNEDGQKVPLVSSC